MNILTPGLTLVLFKCYLINTFLLKGLSTHKNSRVSANKEKLSPNCKTPAGLSHYRGYERFQIEYYDAPDFLQ